MAASTTKQIAGDREIAAQAARTAAAPGRKYARWRIVSLVVVHALILLHLCHWRWYGKTLAPLEFAEAMTTLNAGVVTAGFVFMALALGSVLLFGRLFCAWACHMVAVQDAAAWLLKKAGVAPKPVRSRLLLVVPWAVMFYMFLLPPLRRAAAWALPGGDSLARGLPEFSFRLTTDADGLASFATEDFWRNLPGPALAITTLLVCGFAAVYLLGSRGFCNYVCPYGALFGVADRTALGQILLTGHCIQCAKCTAACPSGVRVHAEVVAHGRVVDSGCFKDLHCITACPEQALSYGFARPWSKLGSPGPVRATGSAVRYDFSTAEDLAMLAALGVALAIFVGLPEWVSRSAGSLYGQMSLFLGLTLSAMTAVALAFAWRLARRSYLQLRGVTLKSQGRLTRSGCVYFALVAAWVAFVVHSGFVQYHAFHVARAVDLTMPAGAAALRLRPVEPEILAIARRGQYHLTQAARWGAFADPRLPRQEAWLALVQGDLAVAQQRLRAAAEATDDADTWYQLGRVAALDGQCGAAADAFFRAEKRSGASDGRLRHAVVFGAEQLDSLGLHLAAVCVLEEAARQRPDDERVAAALARLRAAASTPN